MSESKRIKIDDQVNTESEYEALKKEIALLKQTVEEQCARERERIAELKALEDINCTLLTTGKWSDVTLVVGEKTAAAHKLILSSRSSVFEALFAEPSNAENRVEIDVQADVLDHFLGFIYTGKVPELEPKMAQGLLAAAEKYQVEQLKSIAEDYLNSLASITPRPLPPVARLKDPCLIALFRQLPPADQMTARTVCHRWSDLVPYAARSTRSLAIIVNQSQYAAEDQFNRLLHGPDWELLQLLKKEDGTPLYRMHSLTKWNSLQFDTFDEQTIISIMATFPVLKELLLSAELYQKDDYYFVEFRCNCTTTKPHRAFFDHLVHLLEHWRPQLTTLKLDIRSSFEAASSCGHLGAAINSLSALKHLAYNLYWNRQLHCPHISILPQLTHLTANSDHFADILYQQQQHDPQNLALVQICYDLGDWREEYERANDGEDFQDANDTVLRTLTYLNSDLRRRFVRIGYVVNFRPNLRHYFPSLTSLYVKLSDVSIRDFLTYASQLTQLVHLQPDIDFTTIRPDDQPHHLLPQLKSVKVLQLDITDQLNHTAIESLNLPWTMPNVQVLQIDYVINPHECTTCGIISHRPRNDKALKRCLRQMLLPLKRNCTQLHTIQYGRDLGEQLTGTAEQLLRRSD